MSSLLPCRVLGQCRHFSTTLQRHRRKPNIQRPRIQGIERRILNAITVPIFPPDTRSPTERCFEEAERKKMQKKSEIMEAYDAFRVSEALRLFENHQMVAICHALPLSERDFKQTRATIVTAGFNLKFARNDLALEAIEGTKFANLAPYLTATNAYIVSEEIKVAELVKVLRKTPSFALLGGLVDNQILSRDQMMNVAKLPPLDIMRGELLTILSASASKTSRLLGRHSQDLSASLTQLVKQGSEGQVESSVEGQGEGGTSGEVEGDSPR